MYHVRSPPQGQGRPAQRRLLALAQSKWYFFLQVSMSPTISAVIIKLIVGIILYGSEQRFLTAGVGCAHCFILYYKVLLSDYRQDAKMI